MAKGAKLELIKFVPGKHNGGTGKQEYHYKCKACGKTSTKPQARDDVSDYCQPCVMKLEHPRLDPESFHGRGIRQPSTVHTIICPGCGEEFETTVNSLAKLKDLCCNSCGQFKRPKRKNKSSKYIGVCIQRNGRGSDAYGWRGKMRIKGETPFSCFYRASDLGTDEEKQDLCAIQRELVIIEKDLPNNRNFKGDELDVLILKYVRKGLL